MKSFVAVLALAASALAVPGGNRDPGLPDCRDPAGSCKRLPPKSTKECNSLINKYKIPVATCGEPTSVKIVTVTETAKPKFWKTSTQFITSTSTLTEHKNITVSSTVYKTNVATITNTYTAVASSTLINTQHVNITSTKQVTAKATITTTQIVDQTKETCAPAPRDVLVGDLEKRDYNNRLPEDCSCFLTSTSYTGVRTVKTTETFTPTVVKTSQVPAKATITTTWTITVPVTSTIVSTNVATVQTTTTQKVTQVVSTTWTQTVTQTTTSVTTTTATKNLDVCATAAPLPSGVSSRPGYVKERPVPGANNFKDCCRACFNQDGCAFYDFDDKKKACTISIVDKKGDCVTDSCPKGKADISLAKNPKDLFGYGPCVGASW